MQVSSLLAGFSVPVVVYVMLNILRKVLTRKVVDLHGKVVVITGASSGVGEACAHVFYRAGAQIVLCARRLNELERVKADLVKTKLSQSQKTYTPEVVQLDLLDTTDIQTKADRITTVFGQVDVLINNAGISNRGSVLDTQMDVFEQLIKVNYLSHAALTKAFLPGMVDRQQGSIVEVCSTQGKLAIPHRAPYSASKHAALAFCDSLRAEVANSNVNVSVIIPGYIATSLSVNALSSDGSAYGVMDPTTAGGMTPMYVAEQILSAVEYGKQEVILESLKHKIAIYLRTLSPWLFFYLMKNRATKSKTS